MRLRRYWFDFSLEAGREYPIGIRMGCGVTAHDRADAETLMKENIFDGRQIPPITNCIEDIDVSTLDANHVLPNMGLVIQRGIWFPLGYPG